MLLCMTQCFVSYEFFYYCTQCEYCYSQAIISLCCIWHPKLFRLHFILLYPMWVLDNCQAVISLYVFVFDAVICVVCISYYCTQCEYCYSQTVISLYVVVCDILICVVRISYYWTQSEHCYIQTFIILVVVVHDRVICFVCMPYYCTLWEY